MKGMSSGSTLAGTGRRRRSSARTDARKEDALIAQRLNAVNQITVKTFTMQAAQSPAATGSVTTAMMTVP